MKQTQKSPAPVGAGCEAQNLNKHPDYTAIAEKVNASCRLRRAVLALIQRPVNRRDLDVIIGTTNAPEYVSKLNDLGLKIRCERIKSRDRDGAVCRYGRYHLAQADRDGLSHALAMLGEV